MRVWDIDVRLLCNKHLVAQHNEIHAIYSIITHNKHGFASHPEVMRWRNCTGQLISRHNDTADEMLNRGMNHRSPIVFTVYDIMNMHVLTLWQTIDQQIAILRQKGCRCRIIKRESLK